MSLSPLVVVWCLLVFFNLSSLFFPNTERTTPACWMQTTVTRATRRQPAFLPSTQIEALDLLQVLAFYKLWSECNRTKFLRCAWLLFFFSHQSQPSVCFLLVFFFVVVVVCLASFEFKAGCDRMETPQGHLATRLTAAVQRWGGSWNSHLFMNSGSFTQGFWCQLLSSPGPSLTSPPTWVAAVLFFCSYF